MPVRAQRSVLSLARFPWKWNSHPGTALIGAAIKTVPTGLRFCSAARVCDSCNGKARYPSLCRLARPPFAISCRTFLGHSSMLLKRGLADIKASSLQLHDHALKKHLRSSLDTLTILCGDFHPPVQTLPEKVSFPVLSSKISTTQLPPVLDSSVAKTFLRILPLQFFDNRFNEFPTFLLILTLGVLMRDVTSPVLCP